ncbi:MAG: SGNH/GDSL hydrolase family protein [Leptonema sp. (in: bacteria)]
MSILLAFHLLLHCKTYGETSLPGKNYYDPLFECEKGLLKKEKNLVYLKLREEIRKNFSLVQVKPFLLIAGESTLALFPKEIYEEYLKEFKIVNHAIGGETTLLFLSSMEQDLISLKPDVILISIGGNDLIEGRCISTIVHNINIILFTIHIKLPETYVIFVGIPPVLSWKINSISPILNKKIESLIKSYPNMLYIDLWEILSDEDKPALKQDFYRELDVPLKEYDKLHFNKKGYEEISKKLKPILEKIYNEKYKK